MTHERKDAIGQLLMKWGTGIFRFIVLGVLGLLIWQGKNMVNSAIAQSPDVIEAKTTAATAAVSVELVSNKVDALLVSESRVIDALKQSHTDEQNIRESVATLTERVAGQQGQLSRIEAKQDR